MQQPIHAFVVYVMIVLSLIAFKAADQFANLEAGKVGEQARSELALAQREIEAKLAAMGPRTIEEHVLNLYDVDQEIRNEIAARCGLIDLQLALLSAQVNLSEAQVAIASAEVWLALFDRDSEGAR